jgi:hypothetical protein
MKDYFAILQLASDATRPDIQAAYRRLAKKYHPDVNKSPDAHEKFCEITEAYEFLMNHWSEPVTSAATATARDKKYATFRESEEYARFKKEVRERAQQQAKMRYEKFKQQHEAFQTSGINDLALLLKILLRVAGILLFTFLLLLPVFVALQRTWVMIFLGFLTWPFAGIIGWYMYDNRRNYLMPGKFYYSADRIKHLFTDVHPTGLTCFYCPGRLADSVPYKLELFKLKDLKVSSGGFRQHNVQYVNKNLSLLIPRSQKAFLLHTISSAIKIIVLLGCMLFLPITSIIWRFILGIAAGGMISKLLLLIFGTRSKISYMISAGLVFRVFLWIFCIFMVSRFRMKPFDIITTDSIQFVVTAIVIFDCLIMQFLDLILKRYASRPLVRQYPDVSRNMEAGYLVYNDIPVISVVYPMLKWFIG